MTIITMADSSAATISIDATKIGISTNGEGIRMPSPPPTSQSTYEHQEEDEQHEGFRRRGLTDGIAVGHSAKSIDLKEDAEGCQEEAKYACYSDTRDSTLHRFSILGHQADASDPRYTLHVDGRSKVRLPPSTVLEMLPIRNAKEQENFIIKSGTKG